MAKKVVKGKKGLSGGEMVAIGAGLAAASAGAYYLLGPNAKKHQKKVVNWVKTMEKDVEKKIKTIKNLSEPLYHKTIDSVAETYSKKYKENSAEIKAFAKVLKGEWKNIEKKSKPVVKQVKKSVKKTAKAVKKVTKKVTRK